METYDPKKSPTEVRQGNRRLMNMRVLLFSGVAIVVAFVIILFVFNAMAPSDTTVVPEVPAEPAIP